MSQIQRLKSTISQIGTKKDIPRRIFTVEEIETEWSVTYNRLLRISRRCKSTTTLHRIRAVFRLERAKNLAELTFTDHPGHQAGEDGLEIESIEKWFQESSYRNQEELTLPTSCLPTRSMSIYEEHGMTSTELLHMMKKADINGDGVLSRSEFFDMMLDFYNRYEVPSTWKNFWKSLAYADVYTCSPPRLFIPVMCILQVGFWIQHVIYREMKYDHSPDSIEPICSKFAYNPDRHWEIWRFVTYSLVHASSSHLLKNLLGLLIVGIPLEMSHSSIRVAVVYLSGVTAGAMGSAIVTNDKVPLTGSSGGFYALLAAHLASLLLNWESDSMIFRQRMTQHKPAKAIMAVNIRILRLFVLLSFLIIDVGIWVDEKFFCRDGGGLCCTRINYSAHFFGFLAGLIVGFIALKDRTERQARKICLKRILICVTVALYCAAIFHIVWRNLEGSPKEVCSLYHYTKKCQQLCNGRKLSDPYNCTISFCKPG